MRERAGEGEHRQQGQEQHGYPGAPRGVEGERAPDGGRCDQPGRHGEERDRGRGPSGPTAAPGPPARSRPPCRRAVPRSRRRPGRRRTPTRGRTASPARTPAAPPRTPGPRLPRPCRWAAHPSSAPTTTPGSRTPSKVPNQSNVDSGPANSAMTARSDAAHASPHTAPTSTGAGTPRGGDESTTASSDRLPGTLPRRPAPHIGRSTQAATQPARRWSARPRRRTGHWPSACAPACRSRRATMPKRFAYP